ncbi:hypothetical protein GQ54DRAFT_246286, partial [Martensiomyces pterosporus]
MKEREVWPNLPIYNSLIVACLKVGNFGRAWGVFEHLRYSISKPDEITFSIMIHACAKNGEAHGFQPDFYTYNTLIYACAVKKNLGLARGIFRDMLERSMNPENHGLLKIDSVTISNMLWAYSSYIHPVKNCSWRDVPKEKTDRQRLALIDALMPPAVPGVHNSIGSEASRLMTFYLDVLKGDVTSQLLNAYLSAMINNGRFYEAWRTFLGDFKRFSVLKDGWTFQRMIRLCARTRDVPSAWRVWDEFKAW